MRDIKTYQDLVAVGERDQDRMTFILDAIREHKRSTEYTTAQNANMYYKHQNPTIMRFQHFVYDQFGRAVPDIWKPNNKIASNWYNYFTTQGVLYLLGNGVTFKNDTTKEKLGRNFDKQIQEAATEAKNSGVSFGFWNNDRLEVFSFLEFVPLWDEEDGQLKAGIRFWQVDKDKPLRATLYELDGYTEYIRRKDKELEIFKEKRPYIIKVAKSDADGERVVAWSNYPSFPIVPLWNINKQSDIVGNQGTLDAYDLMISGLINNVSDGEFIYWVLKNCGGMTSADDAKFVEQLKLTRVAHADGDDGASVESHKVDVEFKASAEALDRLEKQLFNDFMALKVQDISAGAVTATQIMAAYEPINQKTDQFEGQVTEFVLGILALAGIEDMPTYTRSIASNQQETVDMVITAAEHLSEEYIVKKILTALGDADMVNEVLLQISERANNRIVNNGADSEEEVE